MTMHLEDFVRAVLTKYGAGQMKPQDAPLTESECCCARTL